MTGISMKVALALADGRLMPMAWNPANCRAAAKKLRATKSDLHRASYASLAARLESRAEWLVLFGQKGE